MHATSSWPVAAHLLVLLGVAAAAEEAPSSWWRTTTPRDAMADASNDLGVALLQDFASSRGNVALSPLAAAATLVALWEGARGDTALQLREALELPQDRDRVRAGFRDLHRLLRARHGEHQLTLKDLFLLSGDARPLEPAYVDVLRFYGYQLGDNDTSPVQVPETVPPPSAAQGTTTVVTEASTEPPTPAVTETTAAAPGTTIPVSVEESVPQVVSAAPVIVTTVPNVTTQAPAAPTTTTTTVPTVAPAAPTTTTTVPTVAPAAPTTTVPDVVNTEAPAAPMTTTTVPNVVNTEAPAAPTTSTEAPPPREPPPETTAPAAAPSSSSSPIEEPTTSVPEGASAPPAAPAMATATTVPDVSTEAPAAAAAHGVIMTTTAFDSSTEAPPPRPQETTAAPLSSSAPGNPSTVTTDNIPATTVPASVDAGAETTTTVPAAPDAPAAAGTTTTRSVEVTEAPVPVAGTAETATDAPERTTTMTPMDVPEATEAPVPGTATEVDVPEATEAPGTTLVDISIASEVPDDSPTTTEAPRSRRAILGPSSRRLQHLDDDTTPFLVRGALRRVVPALRTWASLPFARIPALEACVLQLPLQGDSYRVLLVLPSSPAALPRTLEALRSFPLRQVVRTLRPTALSVAVPFFSLHGAVLLTSTLQHLGVWDVFDPRLSDLSCMSAATPLYVVNVEQRVDLDLRPRPPPEEAARGWWGGEEDSFVADRAFLFFVLDGVADVALLAGKVEDPLSSDIT